MKELVLKYAKYAGVVGYPLFYVCCLIVFASLTFPYDRLRDRVVTSYNAEQRATGVLNELQIEKMGGYWLSGVRASGIVLSMGSPEAGRQPVRMVIDEATARYALLPALVGATEVDFTASAFGGDIQGAYGASGDDTSFEVSLSNIDLAKIPPLAGVLGVPIEGRLGGTVRFKFPKGKVASGNGQVALEAEGVAVGDGKAKLKGALALPRMTLGTLTLAAEAKDGVLKIGKLFASGKDLDLQGEGRIAMRDVALSSTADMTARFRINDAYRTKSDVTKSLFGAPGSTTPPLFELADPKIKQAKRPDGSYGWNLRGQLAHLDFTPAPAAGKP